MSNIRRPVRIPSALLVLSLIFVVASVVAGQTRLHENSTEKRNALNRAVVVITTVDREGNALLQGSGFFIAADRVVTNLHVIKNASVIRIQGFDGKTIPISNVVAVDELDDLALLQLASPNTDATILRLAAAAADEGEAIVVMSNPRGARWKLTRGRVGPVWGFKGTGKRIQITASIYPGSSGGPVVNKQGHVVGIAVMHFDGTDGLNFAVPAERLKRLQASISTASLRPAVFVR